MSVLKQLNHWFIGEYLKETGDLHEKEKIRFVFNLNVVHMLSGIVYIIYLGISQQTTLMVLNCLGYATSASIAFVLKYKKNVWLASTVFSLCGAFLLFVNNFLCGSILNIYSSLWLLFEVLYAYFTLNKTSATIVSLINTLAILLSITLTSLGLGITMPAYQDLGHSLNPISMIIPLGFCFYIIFQFIVFRDRAVQELKAAYTEQETLNKALTIREQELIKNNTQLSLLNNKIRESEQRLSDTLKIARLGSWEVNCVERTSAWSDETCEIAGFKVGAKAPTLHEYLGFVHPTDQPALTEHIQKAIREGIPFEMEFRHRLPEGTYKNIFLKVRPMILNEKVVKLQGTVLDITERVKVQQELIEAKEKAEQASSVKSQFLATMSHEIRTPMNAVIGITNLLLEESPQPQQIYNLKTLKFSAENLLSLINDILDFNKIEAGKIDFEQIDFNIQDLVNGIKHSLQTTAREKGISLKIFKDATLPTILCGDPVRLTQILNNLISNAIKFTEEGDVRVNLSVAEEDEHLIRVHFSVTDTGIGIAEENLEYIFEQFTQANSDTTRKFGGTGLGLAITKRLLELQGSTISVNSVVGQGSCFSFSLLFPKSNTHILQERLDKNDDIQVDVLKGIHLLLVDDNSINQLIASKLLAKWNMQIDFAATGKEALAMVKQKDYDIVLMDLQMPEMDGYEAAIAIRQLSGEKYQQLSIIALTASAMHDVKDKVLAVGMNDYIAKPFNPKELYQKISQYVKKPYPEQFV